VLALGLLVPLRRAGVAVRPGLRFPPGVARRARALAGAGVAALAAQQLALVVALRLAFGGGEGSAVVFTLATALFLLPWAVLAVPVATSAFPLLSASADQGRRRRVRPGLPPLVAGGAGAVGRGGGRAGRVRRAGGGPAAARRAWSGRRCGRARAGGRRLRPGAARLRHGRGCSAARCTRGEQAARPRRARWQAGWPWTVADLALVAALPDVDRVVLLGAGSSLGLSVGGGWLLVALRRAAGPGALAGAGRTALVAGGAGLVAAAVALGAAAVAPVDVGGSLPTALVAAPLLALLAVVVHAAVVRLLDPSLVRDVVGSRR
jgi:putative peptidoglycan lipid II flippase